MLSEIRDLLPWGIEHRRHLHRYPELGRQEFKTSTYCQEQMAALGYDIRSSFETGFVADLTVPGATRTIAFRADMDALPAQELGDASYKSCHDGVAHLCGHDVHMSIALTAACYLAGKRDQLTSNIRFIFQPDEEGVGGAQGMIADGVMDGVDEIYALHNDPSLEAGQIRLKTGIMSAALTQFELKITGKSAHGTTPHQGLDALSESVRIYQQLDHIRMRRISPFSPALLMIGELKAGEACNIIAPEANLTGTVRSFDNTVQDALLHEIRSLLQESEQRGFGIEFTTGGCPAINNSEYAVSRVMAAASAVLDSDKIITMPEPWPASEDFSDFTAVRQGALFLLGSGNASKGINQPLHANPFDVDEDCIAYGAAIFAQLAMS